MPNRFYHDDFLLRSEHGVNWFMQDDGDEVHVGAVQDCTSLIDANKALQNSGGTGWSEDKTFRHIARVPTIIQIKWLNEYGIDIHNPDHADGVTRLLNSSEWRYLRPFEWQI